VSDPNVQLRNNGSLSAVIIRADGTVEDVGVVSASYSNPLHQWWWEHVGRRRAAWRTARANRNALRLRKAQEG